MDLSDWLDAGRRALPNDRGHALRTEARARTQATIADHDLEHAAWTVRDAIETLVFLTSHSVRCQSRAERTVLVAARRAGADAGLALLIGAHLSELDHAIPAAPFQGIATRRAP